MIFYLFVQFLEGFFSFFAVDIWKLYVLAICMNLPLIIHWTVVFVDQLGFTQRSFTLL